MTPAAILRYERLALDTNIFIAVEQSTDRTLAPVRLYRGIATSRCQVVTSIISTIEVLSKVFETNDLARVRETLEIVRGGGRITVLPVSDAIGLVAARLRATFTREGRKLKTPDAIQLATAIVSRCELFVTSDRDFPARTIDGVRIVHLAPAK